MKNYAKFIKKDCFFKMFIGGLSAWMTESPPLNILKKQSFFNCFQFLIFKCFRIICSLKKNSIRFLLSFNLYFQQKRPQKLSTCHLPTKCSAWVFVVTNRRNDFSNFQSYHEVLKYVFHSLAKSCSLFWKYS